LDAPEQPATDEQQYRALKLGNGMRVLLVHDPRADKAAAAVDVRVGSLSDPPDLPGMAHFLEHMLFYSSEKYPEEDAYSKFISEHGGMTNAYTAAESTCYMFEVNSAALEGALDRFAQFFIAPLISQDGVAREVKAVDSEHNGNVNSDPWRQAQLWRDASNPDHPFSAFHTGNVETLMTKPTAKGVEVHREVRRFWEDHYSAGVMTAAIVSKATLDELQHLAVAKFSPIIDRQLKAPVFSGDIVTANLQGLLIKVVPEKRWHTVEVQWIVPPERPNYRSQPCGSLSHLLGHEGEGSLFALLKARGLAVELSAGESGLSFSAASLFVVNIVLTDAGHKQIDEVLAIVFDYIGCVLRTAPVEAMREVWEENAALGRLRFRFAERMQPFDAVQSLAHAMQEYPAKDLLLAMHHVPLDFDPAAMEDVLAHLTPQSARVMWCSPDFEGKTTETEYYYGAQYSRGAVPGEWLQRWHVPREDSQLHLPRPNTLISTDFDLQEDSWGRDSDPQQVLSLPLVSAWARPDTSFSRPRAVVYIGFASPAAYSDPQAAVLTKLFTRLATDALNEVSYAAQLAGLHYGVDSTTGGWQLTGAGYSHKLLQLMRLVLERMVALEVDDNRFEVVREALVKDWAALAENDQPYERALYSSAQLLEAKKWHVNQYLQVLPTLAPCDLRAFLPRLCARVKATVYVTGNLPPAAVEQLGNDVHSLLENRVHSQPLFDGEIPEKRVVKLPQGRTVRFTEQTPKPENANSAVAVSLQFGPDDVKRNALGQLVAQLSKRDAFAQLRTKQQLGYIVHMSSWSNLSCRSLIFIIQSSTHSAEQLGEAIEKFLSTFGERLAMLPQSEFDQQVEELAKAKLEAPQRLREVAARHWGELDGGTRLWARPIAEVAALQTLTLPQLQAFYQEEVLGVKTRRKLSVHVVGAGEKATRPDSPSNATTGASHAVPTAPALQGATAEASTAGAARTSTAAVCAANRSQAHSIGSMQVQSPVSEGDKETESASGTAPKAPEGSASVFGSSGGDQETAAIGLGKHSDAGANGDASRVGAEEEDTVEVDDIWHFKRAQELYPAP